MILGTVSVIIPVYNDFRFLKEAIQSVLDQTYRDFEIILVDDGSSNSEQIFTAVESFLSEKIRYVRNSKNIGLAASRNVGIRESKGEFICFLDADDVFRNRKLELQVQQLKESRELPMVFSDEYVIRDSVMLDTPQQFPPGYRMEYPILTRFVQSSFIAVFTAMVRRSVLEEVGFFNESLRWNEDDDLWFRIMLYKEPGYSIYVSGYRRLHDQNMSLNRIRMMFFQIKTFQGWISRCKKAGRPDLKQIIKKRAMAAGRIYFRTTLRRGTFDWTAMQYYIKIVFS